MAYADITGTIEIDTKRVINPQVIGAGVNFAFSDYEYFNMLTGEGWGDIKSQNMPMPNDKKEWKNFFDLMDFSGFQYIRFCVGLTQWEPVNDNEDPYNTDFENGFIFSPKVKEKYPQIPEKDYPYMDAMYKILDHWEKQNKYVVLGNWDEGKGNFCPGIYESSVWLRKKLPDGKDDYSRDKIVSSSIPEFTESLAAIMYNLKIDKKYNCVKGISFYNEPEQFSNYYNTLTEVYNTLGVQLERLGIRDKVKIQAFDGAIFWNREDEGVKDGVTKLLNRAGKNMDIIAVHDYWTYFDHIKEKNERVHGTIKDFMIDSEVKPALEQINTYNKKEGGDRFLVVSEMGSFSYIESDSSKANYMQRLHNAQYTARALNEGVKAVSYWVYNNNYHDHWRFLTFDKNNHFTPESVNYYPMALVMKYIKNGSDIISSKINGATDSNGLQRIWITAAKKGKDITLLIINDSQENANIDISGLKTNLNLRELYVSKQECDKIYIKNKRNNGLNIKLKPESITVLTTYTYGNEKP